MDVGCTSPTRGSCSRNERSERNTKRSIPSRAFPGSISMRLRRTSSPVKPCPARSLCRMARCSSSLDSGMNGSGFPITSASVHPNSRSAAGFQTVMSPSAVRATRSLRPVAPWTSISATRSWLSGGAAVESATRSGCLHGGATESTPPDGIYRRARLASAEKSIAAQSFARNFGYAAAAIIAALSVESAREGKKTGSVVSR